MLMNRALKLVRLYHKKSILQTSEMLGHSPATVQQIESGTIHANNDLVQKYALAFNLETGFFNFFKEPNAENKAAERFRFFLAKITIGLLELIARNAE